MKNIIFLFIVIVSANVFAIPIIKNPELANAVTNAESAYFNHNYNLAAKYSFDVFNLKNLEAQKELETLKSDNGFSYAITLHLIYLDSLLYSRQANDSYKKECKKVIAKYKEQEKEKNLSNLVWVYYHLACYYRSHHNIEMETKTLKEVAELFPKSSFPVRYFNNLIENSPEPLPDNIVSEVKRIFNKNKKMNNNKLTSAMACCKVKLIEKTGGNTYSAAINFLKSYPNSSFEEIKEVVNIAREAISFDNPEQVRDYYNTLMILAIKQANTKDRLRVIGFIMNEKSKLETIMPKLRK